MILLIVFCFVLVWFYCCLGFVLWFDSVWFGGFCTCVVPVEKCLFAFVLDVVLNIAVL